MNRSTVGALAVAGALALGACGSATTTEPGTTATSSGASTSAAAEGSGGQSVAVGDVVPLAELAEKSAAAVKAKGTAHISQSAGGQQVSTGQIDYSGSVPRMAMTMSAEGQEVEIVYTDGVMYMGGAQFAALAGGKAWIKVDPDGTDQLSTMMAPTLRQMESSMTSPAEQLTAFGDVDATVSAVEGDRTTYAVKLTQEQLKKSVEAAAKGLPGGLNEAAVSQLPDGLSYTMTVGAGALPLEMVVDMPGSVMTMTYSKWGEPVTISAPPASEVGTFSG